jgi:hypothetical protein
VLRLLFVELEHSLSKQSVYFHKSDVSFYALVGCVKQCVIRHPYRFPLDQRKRVIYSDLICEVVAVWKGTQGSGQQNDLT